MATTKQKIAAEKMSENIRNSGSKSTGEILKESGYSDSVSKSPQRVTESKGWKELMEDYFPTKTVFRVHKKLLNKKEIVTYQGDFIKTKQPHSDVKYALDMLYKLKGMYKDSEIQEINPFKDWTDEELEAELERLEEEIGVK